MYGDYRFNPEYSSSKWQNNYLMQFNGRKYLVEAKVVRSAPNIFHKFSENYCARIDSYNKPLMVYGDASLTSEFFEDTLKFLQTGTTKSHFHKIDECKGLLAFCDKNRLTHLHRYLTRQFLSEEEKQKHYFEDLEIAALQQNIEEYVFLLQNLKDRSSSNQKKFGGKIKNTCIHFSPSNLEILLGKLAMCNELEFLMVDIVYAYADTHQTTLEDMIHEISNHFLKLSLIVKLPRVEYRMLWRKQLMLSFPRDWIEFAIIGPLIAQQRFLEAKEWVCKEYIPSSVEAVSQGLMFQGHFQAAEELLLQLAGSTDEDEVIALCLPGALHASSPFDLVRETINKFFQTEVPPYHHPKCMYKRLQRVLNAKFNLKLDSSLLLIAIEQFMKGYIEQHTAELFKGLSTKYRESKDYELLLHPCFMEDLEIIKKLAFCLEPVLKHHFYNSETRDILGERIKIISGTPLLDEMIAISRREFRCKRSIAEEAVIQFTSSYLQPYINEQIKPTGISRGPFTHLLRNYLIRANLTEELSNDLIAVALYTYIRKGFEAANIRHRLTSEKPLDPNEPSDIIFINDLHLALEYALANDFEDHIFEDLDPDIAKTTLGSYLTRELFVHAGKACVRKAYPKKLSRMSIIPLRRAVSEKY